MMNTNKVNNFGEINFSFTNILLCQIETELYRYIFLCNIIMELNTFIMFNSIMSCHRKSRI